VRRCQRKREREVGRREKQRERDRQTDRQTSATDRDRETDSDRERDGRLGSPARAPQRRMLSHALLGTTLCLLGEGVIGPAHRALEGDCLCWHVPGFALKLLVACRTRCGRGQPTLPC
jgi:hypothetical protein